MSTSSNRPSPWSHDGKVRCALLSQNHRLLSDALVNPIKAAIEAQAELVAVDLVGDKTAELLAADPDFIVVLGGDGSMLRAARCMESNQVPVLGVNLGSLGFLADIAIDKFPVALQAILEGRCEIVSHLMFDCEIFRDGNLISHTLGLNEAAILGGPPFSLLEIDLFIDGELATSYSCDGLIISTPVGSTAHNLSAGGPIIRKDVQCFVVSAVSPHTLSVRPVVDTAERVFEMGVPIPHETTFVVVDGQVIQQMESNDRVRVRKAEPQFKMIQVSGHSYYKTLRGKLGWGGRIATKRPK